jgi:hypothetical protein
MPVYSWMSAPDISSNAAFRKWVKGVRDAFLGCGWVQTEDTGQITDVDSLTVPAAQNTAAGYFVFARDDDLQDTCPIYVKIEPGRGPSNSNNVPTMWVTVGQSTNGAGSIGDQVITPTPLATSAASYGQTTEYPSYASCDGGGFCLAMWAGYGASNSTNTLDHASLFFAIDRSRTANGEPTGDAFAVMFGCANLKAVRVRGNGGSSGAMSTDSGALPVLMPQTINGATASPTSTLSEDGVTAPVLPVPFVAPGVKPWVSNVVVAVHPGDAGTTSVIQAATINGQTRVYRAWPFFTANSGLVMTTSSAGTLSLGARFWPAIWWEVED